MLRVPLGEYAEMNISVSGDCLRTVTPALMTSTGSVGCACDTRACTSLAARSGSRSRRERHRDARRAIVGAGAADVEHVGDAVDRGVDLRRDRRLDDVGDSAEIRGLHAYGRQCDLGILRDRQAAERDRPAKHQEQRDDGSEDGSIDEKARHDGRSRLLAGGGRGRGFAGRLGFGDRRRFQYCPRQRLLQAFDHDAIARIQSLLDDPEAADARPWRDRARLCLLSRRR